MNIRTPMPSFPTLFGTIVTEFGRSGYLQLKTGLLFTPQSLPRRVQAHMIVFRRATHDSSLRITRQIRDWIRTSHGDASIAKGGNSTGFNLEHKVTVTKIKYSELPKSRSLPDGSRGAPIGEWLGGLEEIESSLDLETSTAQKIEGEPVKSRKRRVSKKQIALEEVGNIDDSEISAIEKPKRKTRRKTDGAASNPDDNDANTFATETAKSSKGRSKFDLKETTESPALPRPTNMLGGTIQENLAKFPHCILLTRVGQFYESYFDQAVEVARLLNIKLTSRPYNKRRIPMCGFPLMHLDKSLKVLVQEHNRFVAMCEEFPRFTHGEAKPEFDRRVARVITPGTLIDEQFLNQYENNFLLSVSSLDCLPSYRDINGTSKGIGLAWIDVSTGEFFTKSSTLDGFRDELARIGPREIVLDRSLEAEIQHPIRLALAEEGGFVTYVSSSQERMERMPDQPLVDNTCTDDIAASAGENTVSAMPILTRLETSAVALLTTYLRANLLEHMPTLSPPNRENTGGRMQIDAHTIRALEIRDGAAEGTTKGSLLSVIKRTVTSSGTRLLTRWLCSPSTSIKEINARQSLVSFFYARPHLRDDILQALMDMEDVSRIVQKFILGRGDTSDLASIHSTVTIWSEIQERINLEKKMEHKERSSVKEDEWGSIDILMSKMSDLQELARRIKMALRQGPGAHEEPGTEMLTSKDLSSEDEQPTLSTRPKQSFVYGQGNWTIKPEFSEELTDLHTTYNKLLADKEKLQTNLQKLYDAPSLTLRSSPGHGMHVHIHRTKRDQSRLVSSPLFVKIAESGSTSSFFHQPWSSLGGQIVDTVNAIIIAEKEAFELLRREVSAFSMKLRRNARILDELDVTMGFANLAAEMNFVQPVLTDENIYEIVNGRHPTVERGLLMAGRVFTPNSVSLAPSSRLHVITGPNMAGKSTFLRQIALVTILAQTGSFVPADHATIGIVDMLFSRVGAKDDLFRDRSTFMVEMLETAEILKRATSKSLVIMDEVGRGTTVKDGLAIAFATVHHLVSMNNCRALFATHFHELADMLGCSNDAKGQGVFEHVGFFCTDVDETGDGHFAYSHRMRPGVNRDSHGLKVAQLAGMPNSAVAVAQDTLAWLKRTKPDEAKSTADLRTLGRALTDVDTDR